MSGVADKRDQRGGNRLPKRLLVRFGTAELTGIGVTIDLSETGIFVKAASVFSPGTALRIELMLPDQKIARLRGTVTWAKKVPPTLARVIQKSGMGVRLLEIDEVYRGYLAARHAG